MGRSFGYSISNMPNIKENVFLANYSVFKIGGPARFFVAVKSEGELIEALLWSQKNDQPVFVLGAGSNTLISDKGFNGLVIKMDLQDINFVGSGKMAAGSGASMARVVSECIKAGLYGFEWGIGIPGTVGGSVRGNAGCFGGEMRQVLESVRVLEIPNSKPQIQNFEFKTFILSNNECKFKYRDSIFKKHPEWVITSAVLKLKSGNPEESRKKILEYTKHRNESQDIGAKSAGCIFKNIPWDRKNIDKEKVLKQFPDIPPSGTVYGIPVSYLIDQAGLKGKKIGKIYISPKHANYIVNEGGGTAREVLRLVALIKEKVHTKFNIILEEEIQMVGF